MTRASSLRILSPCDQDWNAMTPTAEGRHCAGCGRDVVDLRRASEEEAADVARRGGCVRLRVDRRGQPIFSRLRRVATGVAIAAGLAACGPGASTPPERPPEGASESERRRWNQEHGHDHAIDDEGIELMGEPTEPPPANPAPEQH